MQSGTGIWARRIQGISPSLRDSGASSWPWRWESLSPKLAPVAYGFRPHRSKAFDVCWPLIGEPKILISIKSMQNAYPQLDEPD